MKRIIFYVLSLILLTYIFNSCSCERESTFILTEDIKKCNTVISYINDNEIENIIYIGLDLLNVDSVVVSIYDLPEFLKTNKINQENFVINALITKNFNRNYSIYLNNNSPKYKRILYLSHELIHLEQFNSNKLEVFLNSGTFRYEGKIYIAKEIEYSRRPWEIHAFNEQDNLRYKIESILY